MKIFIPEKGLLSRTGEVDYFDWNYKFPIKYIQRYRFKKIIELIGDKKCPVLLEVGTGSGIFLPELSKHAESIYACDIHSDFDNIKQLCIHFGIKNYYLSTQNLEKTNFLDNHFDIIVAVSVLEFVNDLDKALSEIKRILKKDGVFITICPMESRFLDFLLSFYTRKKPKDEFGVSRMEVSKSLETNFVVDKKGYMIPFIGKIFPIYTHYKLKKK